MRCFMDSSSAYQYNNFIHNLSSVPNLCDDWKVISDLKQGDILYDKGAGALMAYPGFGIMYNTKSYLSALIWDPSQTTALHGPEIDSFKLLEKKVIQTMQTVAALDGGIHGTVLKAEEVFSTFKELNNLQENITAANQGLLNFIQTHEGRTHKLTSEKEDDIVVDYLKEIKSMVDSQILNKIVPIKRFIQNNEDLKPLLKEYLANKIFAEESKSSSAIMAEFQSMEIGGPDSEKKLENHNVYNEMLEDALKNSFINPDAEEKMLAINEKLGAVFPMADPKVELRAIFKAEGGAFELTTLKGSNLEMPEIFLRDFSRTNHWHINGEKIFSQDDHEKIYALNDDKVEKQFMATAMEKFVLECCGETSIDKISDEQMAFAQKIAKLVSQETYGDLHSKLSNYVMDPETLDILFVMKSLECQLAAKWDLNIDEKTVVLDFKQVNAMMDKETKEIMYYIVAKREITIPKDELLKDEDLPLPSLKIVDSFSYDLHSEKSKNLFFDYM